MVHPIRLSKLKGGASPVSKDVVRRVKEVRFAFPGWPREAIRACFVESVDDSAPASHGPVAENLGDLQTLDGHGTVVLDDVEGGGVGGVVVLC